MLMCKGADNVMLARVKPVAVNPAHAVSSSPGREEDADGHGVLRTHLRLFANEGLRTLVLAQREISQEEYDDWRPRFEEASNALSGRNEALAAVAEQIESNLTMVGATAIEDKLQDGVPAAIASLARGGIKIWVLTGDKEETAINIGYACNLLRENMKLILVNGRTTEAIRTQLGKLLALPEISEMVRRGQCSEDLALVVDGEALSRVLDVDALSTQLYNLAQCCSAVVACRVSPAQKASIVQVSGGVRCERRSSDCCMLCTVCDTQYEVDSGDRLGDVVV